MKGSWNSLFISEQTKEIDFLGFVLCQFAFIKETRRPSTPKSQPTHKPQGGIVGKWKYLINLAAHSYLFPMQTSLRN